MQDFQQFDCPSWEVIKPKYLPDTFDTSVSYSKMIGSVIVKDPKGGADYKSDYYISTHVMPYNDHFKIEYYYYDRYGVLKYHREDGPSNIIGDAKTRVIYNEEYQVHGEHNQSRKFNKIEYTYSGGDGTRCNLVVMSHVVLEEDKSLMYPFSFQYRKSIKYYRSTNDKITQVVKSLFYYPKHNEGRIKQDLPCSITHIMSDDLVFQKQYKWLDEEGRTSRYIEPAVMYRDDGETKLQACDIMYHGQGLTEQFKNAGWNVDAPRELKEFIWGMIVGGYENE